MSDQRMVVDGKPVGGQPTHYVDVAEVAAARRETLEEVEALIEAERARRQELERNTKQRTLSEGTSAWVALDVTERLLGDIKKLPRESA